MQREVYDYYPGRIAIRFRHESRFDLLRMYVTIRSEKVQTTYLGQDWQPCGTSVSRPRATRISLGISSVHCPFRDMLAWLEAISAGVQGCSWRWDPEGADNELIWAGGRYETGTLTVHDGGRKRDCAVMLHRAQLVGMFYGAFRGFVESPEYHAERYEELTLGEQCLAFLGWRYTEDELLGQLLPLGHHEAEDRLPFGRIPVQWNRWDTKRRRVYLRELFTREMFASCAGGPLRSMRSMVVERWLAGQRGDTTEAEAA